MSSTSVASGRIDHEDISVRLTASLPFVHPHLEVEKNPSKGRLVRVKRPIKDGEVVLIDTPYALVPAMIVDEPPFSLCSRQQCNRRIPVGAATVSCPEKCLEEVVWCSNQCQSQDKARHGLECSWLKHISPEIRQSQGDATFGLLWMIARILINKTNENTSSTANEITDDKISTSHFHRKGWAAVWNLDGGPDHFPAALINQWGSLVNNYLVHELLGVKHNPGDILRLICKVETNSFGLYPGITGRYPVVSHVSRGDYYGGGIYPTAAMFNHACCPNITHEVDANGRRMFKAGRDIEAGEECCITYFDLFEYPDVTSRKEAIKNSWSFFCSCERCNEEGSTEFPDFLQDLEF
ncbi:hypothetical protein B0I35DRAFT_276542 [Stachybotrys elegans]|uniref:SET domain-containing protein n=1 Tax=Stachybotrys elegans TaxID=80388 RepID=A0A8K0SS01_9HYPO|nr:hypothetical protein B0I35DRAFT_276542 [Stachybotrys elegans]